MEDIDKGQNMAYGKQLEEMLDHLYKFFPTIKDMGLAMGIHPATVGNWRRGRTRVNAYESSVKKVIALYNKYKDKTPSQATLLNSVWARDHKEERQWLGARPVPLEIGKEYTISAKQLR